MPVVNVFRNGVRLRFAIFRFQNRDNSINSTTTAPVFYGWQSGISWRSRSGGACKWLWRGG